MGSRQDVASNTETILAARLHEHGAPLRVEAVPLPEPSGKEVRVGLHFAGVNPIDGYIGRGLVAGNVPLPRTLGGEASGTLDGTPVLVAGGGLGASRDGVWAEAANVPREAIHELPAAVSPQAAAGLGVAGLTAWHVVHELAEVGEQDRVFVLGAAGGVGSMIVSLAVAAGATVWGQTGTEEKSGLIRSQGAERALIGDAKEVAAAMGEFAPTVVFDPLGGEFARSAIDAMTVGGRMVSFGTSAGAEVSFNMQTLYRNSLRLLGYGGMQLSPEDRRWGLRAALDALAAGQLKVAVDQLYGLAEVNQALAHIADRRAQGKVLLKLSRSQES